MTENLRMLKEYVFDGKLFVYKLIIHTMQSLDAENK